MPILPKSTIGIFGGGQLGRMVAMAARSLGYRVQVLDPDPSCPARFVVDNCFSAALDDVSAAADMARGCDVVTIEIEKVGLDAMRAAAQHAPTHPSAEVLEIIQHRARQKEWLRGQGAPAGAYRVVSSASELGQAARELIGDSGAERKSKSGIAQGHVSTSSVASSHASSSTISLPELFVKAAQGGYDGRGQAGMREASEAAKVWEYLGAEVCVAEKTIEIAQEISVLVARRASGQTAVYPPALNHHENRILDWSVIPAPIAPELAAHAQQLAERLADALHIVGLLTVEMFVTTAGELLVNELAPRPHNSYHASERANATSQFEQCVRAICDLPLGSVEVQKPAAIVNLLGDLWIRHPRPRFDEALAVEGVRLHLYEKQSAKPGRKMGHLSAVGATPEEAVERVKKAKAILDF